MRWLPLIALVAAGCAHSPPAGSAIAGMPAGGTVDFAVAGTRDIAATRVDGTGFRALLVRMRLDNRSPYPWTVQPQEQVAHLGTLGALLPADASTHTVVVPPGQQRTLELFYPMPRPQYGTALERELTIDWRVRLPTGEVRQRSNLDAQMAAVSRTLM